MIDYNIVKFCRICRDRFVVPKVDAKKFLCKKCQLKINKGLMKSDGGKK